MTEEKSDENPLYSFDWTAFGSPSHAVVMTVADEVGKDPVDVEPLYTAVDPDALDSLLQPASGSGSFDGHVQFEYLEYLIVLDAHGQGQLYDRIGQAGVGADSGRGTTGAADD